MAHAALGRMREGCLVVILACAWWCAPAQTLKASAAQVKAAYLLKIPGFVEWPAGGADAVFVIAVLEADDVLRALEELGKGTRVMGRPVRIVRVSRDEDPPAAQLVFVGAGVRDAAAAVARARADGRLLVADRPDGIAQGAALQFVEVGGRIRFEAAPENAARHGLKLSARLLSVAVRADGGAS